MKYILKQLQALTAIASPSGYTRAAAEYTMAELTRLGFSPEMTRKGCVLTCLGGEGAPLVLSAHLDTLGGMVAQIKSNGRLKLSPVGGIIPANIETENCIVVTRDGKRYDGCFQMNNASAHVNAELRSQPRSFDTMEVVLDEKTVSREDTLKLGICEGDYVCFDPRTVVTPTGYIKSRFLDDKLSVAILLGLAKHVSEGKVALKRRVYTYITVYEEVGHGCRASIPEEVEEIVCVDMGCVGEGLNCTERQVSICAKDSAGPSDYELTGRLIDCAKKHKLDYAVDIYPHYGSDADAALGAGYDLRHSLIGSGVYASHGYERSHTDGVKNTLSLVEAFVGEEMPK